MAQRFLFHTKHFVRIGVHAIAPREIAVAFAFAFRMDGVRQQRDGDALLRIHPKGCSRKASMSETARTYMQSAGARLFRRIPSQTTRTAFHDIRTRRENVNGLLAEDATAARQHVHGVQIQIGSR